jgi:hypothetical protein
LLQDVLRLSPREANARVRAAAALGPRTGLTGEPLGPLRPATAEASADGLLSGEHVEVICRALKELPSMLPVSEVDGLEGTLVEAAMSLPANRLVVVATRMRDTFKPDGVQPSEEEARKLRYLTAHVCRDGMVEGKFRLSPEAGAVVLGVLHSQAAPLPAADGTPDPRSYQQRMADAFEDLARLGLRAGSITPHGRGVALNLTMSREQYETGRGLVETSFGQLLTVDTALELAREASIALIVQAANGAIMDYGHARRYATRAQARTLAARDHGCSFPGCLKPAEWADRHHVVPWRDGGKTDLGNLTLLCGPHHREFESKGWICQMIDGLPWWVPPKWIDPDQRPRQNTRISRGT